MHLEFVLVGVPISNQSAGTSLAAWRLLVAGQAQRQWARGPLTSTLKAVVINFHAADRPSLDLDKMSKPILDAMQDIVYEDDRQVKQLELTHVRIDAAFVFVGVSKQIMTAVQAGAEFMYVRIENAVEPFPLPG